MKTFGKIVLISGGFFVFLIAGLFGLSTGIFSFNLERTTDSEEKSGSAWSFSFGSSKQELPDLPPEREQIELVKESFKVNAKGLKARNMKVFYADISKMWQKQTSVEELNETFRPIFDYADSVAALRNLHPRMTKSWIDDDGVLHLTGHYLTETKQIGFGQQYWLEGGDWKLLAFSCDSGPLPTSNS